MSSRCLRHCAAPDCYASGVLPPLISGCYLPSFILLPLEKTPIYKTKGEIKPRIIITCQQLAAGRYRRRRPRRRIYIRGIRSSAYIRRLSLRTCDPPLCSHMCRRYIVTTICCEQFQMIIKSPVPSPRPGSRGQSGPRQSHELRLPGLGVRLSAAEQRYITSSGHIVRSPDYYYFQYWGSVSAAIVTL